MISDTSLSNDVIQVAQKLYTGTVRGIITLFRQSNVSIKQYGSDVSESDSRSTAIDNHVGSGHIAAETARQEAGDSSNLRWHAGTLEANLLFLCLTCSFSSCQTCKEGW